MTLTHEQLRAVRRALRAGARYTEIARDLDLAVGTIARIASDRKLRRRKLDLLTDADLPEDDPPPEYAARRLRRCPGCGGMVYQWPCLACRLTGRAGQDGETERRRDGVITAEESLPPSLCLSVPHSDSPEIRLGA